jgi:hypothetical protein
VFASWLPLVRPRNDEVTAELAGKKICEREVKIAEMSRVRYPCSLCACPFSLLTLPQAVRLTTQSTSLFGFRQDVPASLFFSAAAHRARVHQASVGKVATVR